MTKHRLQRGGASNDEQVAREPFDDLCQSIPVLPCCHGNNKEGDIKSPQTKDWQRQTSVKITGSKWTVFANHKRTTLVMELESEIDDLPICFEMLHEF